PVAEGLACGHHAVAHILAAAAAYVGQRLAVGALWLVIASAFGSRELAADEDLVGLHHREAFGLWGGAVGAVTVEVGLERVRLAEGLAHELGLRSQNYDSTSHRRRVFDLLHAEHVSVLVHLKER